MKTNNIDIVRLTGILQQVKTIRFAYVFGSQVKNKMHFGSDLDIAVYFDNEPGLLDIGQLVNELETAANCMIDLVSLNGLYVKNPKLAYTVINEGILLFCHDKGLLVQYKEKAYINYLDFKPVIDLFEGKLYDRISSNRFAITEK